MCLIKNKKYHPFNRPLIAEEDGSSKTITKMSWKYLKDIMFKN